MVVSASLAAQCRGLSRNAPCPCASGRRFKLCCGAPNVASLVSGQVETSKLAGLAAQQRFEFAEAVAHYEIALRHDPLDFDAAHMRAVALYQMGCMRESLEAFLEMLGAGLPMSAVAWHNLGLTVAQGVQLADDPALLEKTVAYQSWSAERREASPDFSPTVAVVVASYNHIRYIGAALESVLGQTRLPDELIVIDDGSSDGSADYIREVLRNAPFPTQVIARENRGAAATFNEAIALAKSDWIAPLNSDDRFAPERIERLIAACCRTGIDWGFGRVNVVDATGQPSDTAPDTLAHSLRGVANTGYMSPTTGIAFLLANPAISTGNIFFRKTLWQQVGGFRDWRYNHDWHFALQACLCSEPIRVAAALYDYRIHESNTISENNDAVKAECAAMRGQALAQIAAFDVAAGGNPFAPCPAVWRRAFYSIIGGIGCLELLPELALRSLAAELSEVPRLC
ncbi:MAG: glycosyltransferase [Betaproteobacteria bacterium]|nr:MAG: glycosyltransferase [Betaproteobacteria bacterium]